MTLTLYVLSLEYDKYYIGITTDIVRRFQQHCSGEGAEYTKKYKPISIVELQYKTEDFQENTVVKTYMLKYGINNVRGGSYSQLQFSDELINILTKELNHETGGCMYCGKMGHQMKRCKIKVLDNILETYDLYKLGNTFEEISKKRSLNIKIIESHIVECIKGDVITDKSYVNLTEKKYLKIIQIIKEQFHNNYSDLKGIFNYFQKNVDKDITFADIKFSIAFGLDYE